MFEVLTEVLMRIQVLCYTLLTQIITDLSEKHGASLYSDLAAQEVNHMDCLTVKFNAQCSFRTYVPIYQMTWYNIPGDLNLHGVETSVSEKPQLNLHVESLEHISLRGL